VALATGPTAEEEEGRIEKYLSDTFSVKNGLKERRRFNAIAF